MAGHHLSDSYHERIMLGGEDDSIDFDHGGIVCHGRRRE